MMGPVGGLLLAFALASMAQGQEQKLEVQGHLDRIHRLLAETWTAYESGDREAAFRLARAAYLDHFEFVEIPLRLVDADLTLDMEYRFAHLRNRIRAGAPPAEVRKQIASLDQDLREVAKRLQAPGLVAPLLTGLASFALLLREGIEALLILSVLLTFLRTHRPDLRKPLLWGAFLALPAGALTWLLLIFLFRATGLAREVMEGVVALLAGGLLVYVTFWISRRLDLRYWMEFLRARAWEAATSRSTGALAALGFLSVYREAVEVALFYQTLAWMARGMSLWLWIGAGGALGVLAFLGWALFSLGRRLPLRLFLGSAAAVIMAVSLGVIGNAVRAFQSAGLLPFTPIPGLVPRLNPFVADLLGLYPVREPLLAQGVLFLVYGLFGLWLFLRQRRSQASVRPMTHADRR